MRRNPALSILFVTFVALAATAGRAQTDCGVAADHPPATQTGSAPQPAEKADQAKTPEAATPAKIANAKQGQAANPAQTGEHASAANSSSDLNAVLAKMNQSAAGFKTAQGEFEFETYQELFKEKDYQNGRIYFRRGSKGVDAAFKIEGKSPKQVIYKDGMIRIYQPKINQISERDVSKNKSGIEAFLSLGFGARGDDLLRDYDVKMAGWEMVGGVKTVKLDLIPKDQKMRQTYSKIVLWIDPEQDLLLQQQFFEPSGDYRLARYTNMKRNGNISDDAFHLKTTGKPTIVPMQ